MNPKDLVNQLAKSYTNNVIDQRPIEKTYHSATEIDIAFNRAKALNVEIKASATILSEQNIHPNVAKELTAMLDFASDWVELFGLFMKQVNELIECLNVTAERLKALKANKK